ncbi:MAG TPA: alpha/beta fold hydrolase [Rubrivivax sp.]|nr:alpha/beta fold hydrolase [Rubrivivax sp.]
MADLPERLSTRDALQLHLQHWPAAGRAAGSVLIVHGLGEHIGRYRHVAAQLNAWGWQAFGYDQRGHGGSGGPRGGLAADDDLLHDLAAVIDAVRAALAPNGGPLVLLGHSMGGLVAARFAAGEAGAAWLRPVEALVLSSPALDPGMSMAQKLLLASLGRLAPNLALGNGLKPEWISRDAQVVRDYTADSSVHDRITPRLARFIVDGGAVVAARAGGWRVPTLLMYAGSDRCVAPAGSAGFAAAAPQALVAVHEFRRLYHEIFNEPEQAEVFGVLQDWLAALELPAPQSAP